MTLVYSVDLNNNSVDFNISFLLPIIFINNENSYIYIYIKMIRLCVCVFEVLQLVTIYKCTSTE